MDRYNLIQVDSALVVCESGNYVRFEDHMAVCNEVKEWKAEIKTVVDEQAAVIEYLASLTDDDDWIDGLSTHKWPKNNKRIIVKIIQNGVKGIKIAKFDNDFYDLCNNEIDLDSIAGWMYY